MEHHLVLELYGLVEHTDVAPGLLAQLHVVEYAQVVKAVELLAYVAHLQAVAARAVYQPAQGYGLVLGEVDGGEEAREERRRLVEAVGRAALLDHEARLAEEVEVVIQVAARYAHPLAQLVDGVAAVLCHQEHQLQLSFQLVVAHGSVIGSQHVVFPGTAHPNAKITLLDDNVKGNAQNQRTVHPSVDRCRPGRRQKHGGNALPAKV